jgi:hypothetical protein
MRGVLAVLLVTFLAACDRRTSNSTTAPPPTTSPASVPATAPIMTEMLLTLADGRTMTVTVPIDDPDAAATILRPLLVRAFDRHSADPRPVQWLINDVRRSPFKLPGTQPAGVDLTMTVGVYQEYRVVNSRESTDGWMLQHRASAEDAWDNWAGAADQAAGVTHAMRYLMSDLKSIRTLIEAR